MMSDQPPVDRTELASICLATLRAATKQHDLQIGLEMWAQRSPDAAFGTLSAENRSALAALTALAEAVGWRPA